MYIYIYIYSLTWAFPNKRYPREKVLEEVPGETDRGRLLPKPKKEAKPKKEKTWKEIGTEVP